MSARGLFHAAQWAAELLTQIDVDDDDYVDDDDDDAVAERLRYGDDSGGKDHAFGGDYDAIDDVVEDEVLLAKTYFDMKEYRRAAAVLTRLPSFAALVGAGF